MLITLLYSCPSCGLKDRKCIVPERDRADDVTVWLHEKVMPCIRDDHASASPRCRAKTIADLKIPVDKNNPDHAIGERVPGAWEGK